MMHTRSQKLAFAVITFAIALLHVCVLVNAYGHMHHQSPNRSPLNPVTPHPRLQVSDPTFWDADRRHWDVLIQDIAPGMSQLARYKLGDIMHNQARQYRFSQWPTRVVPLKRGGKPQEIYHNGMRGMFHRGIFVPWNAFYNSGIPRWKVDNFANRISTGTVVSSHEQDVFEPSDSNAVGVIATIAISLATSLITGGFYYYLEKNSDLEVKCDSGQEKSEFYLEQMRIDPDNKNHWEWMWGDWFRCYVTKKAKLKGYASYSSEADFFPHLPIHFHGGIRVTGKDDETWPQSNEYVDRTKTVRTTLAMGANPIVLNPYHVRWGGECRVEVYLAARLVKPGEVEMRVMAKLFEGTSESTNDLEDQKVRTFRLSYPYTKGQQGPNVSRVIELRNTETGGGDTATINVNFSVGIPW